ncbi:MAG: hypothetical protein ACI4JA_01055 [Oscillospiraceae bacterium]
MKLKKILSAVVAGAMAVTAMASLSMFGATAETAEDIVLGNPNSKIAKVEINFDFNCVNNNDGELQNWMYDYTACECAINLWSGADSASQWIKFGVGGSNQAQYFVSDGYEDPFFVTYSGTDFENYTASFDVNFDSVVSYAAVQNYVVSNSAQDDYKNITMNFSINYVKLYDAQDNVVASYGAGEAVEPNVLYAQKTDVVNGVYAERFVMLITEEQAAAATKVDFTLGNGAAQVVKSSGNYYTEISAAGDTLVAPEGYVFVAYAVTNIPEDVTLSCSAAVQ